MSLFLETRGSKISAGIRSGRVPGFSKQADEANNRNGKQLKKPGR